MEAARFSKTMMSYLNTTQHHSPEDDLHIHLYLSSIKTMVILPDRPKGIRKDLQTRVVTGVC
jgi:hypothetical protein